MIWTIWYKMIVMNFTINHISVYCICAYENISLSVFFLSHGYFLKCNLIWSSLHETSGLELPTHFISRADRKIILFLTIHQVLFKHDQSCLDRHIFVFTIKNFPECWNLYKKYSKCETFWLKMYNNLVCHQELFAICQGND